MKRFIALCIIIASVFIYPVSANTYIVIIDKDNYRIWVIKDKRILIFFQDKSKSFVFSIAIGKDEKENKTPEGLFETTGKEENYYWHPTKDQKKFYRKMGVILSKAVKYDDPHNPWGSRRLRLNVARIDGFPIYIHETNEPSAIGKAVTTGCIRMRKKDMSILYPLIKKKEKVKIVKSFPTIIKWL